MPKQSALLGPRAPLAGHFEQIIESFLLSRDDFHSAVENVSAFLSAVDLAILITFGWLLVPYTRIIYSFIIVKRGNKKDDDDNKTMKGEETGREEKENKNIFENSYVFLVVDHLSQIARLALLVYACDCVVSLFTTYMYIIHSMSMRCYTQFQL